MWAAIFHISDVQILHNEPFNEIRDTVGSISDRVSEKIQFVTNDASNCVKVWLLATVLHNLKN